jgi:hypothetical protein
MLYNILKIKKFLIFLILQYSVILNVFSFNCLAPKNQSSEITQFNEINQFNSLYYLRLQLQQLENSGDELRDKITQKALDLMFALKRIQNQGFDFPHDSTFYKQGEHVTDPEIIRFILELRPAKSLSQSNRLHFLSTIERERIDRKEKWFDSNPEIAARRKNESFMEWIRRVYLIENLEISVSDMDTLQITETILETSYHNKCPILAACEFLGLDTRIICKCAFHVPHLRLLKKLDSRLQYSRDYQNLRPHQPNCVDRVVLSDKATEETNEDDREMNIFSVKSLNTGEGFISAIAEMLKIYNLDINNPLVDDLIISLLQRVESSHKPLTKKDVDSEKITNTSS